MRDGSAFVPPRPAGGPGSAIASPRRVTFAMLASIYDVIPKAARRELFWPADLALGWSLQEARVESTPVRVESATARALRAPMWRAFLVEIPEAARRCPWCGCVESFACIGGCAWLPDGRCSACYGRSVVAAQLTLAPGASIPRVPRALRGGGFHG